MAASWRLASRPGKLNNNPHDVHSPDALFQAIGVDRASLAALPAILPPRRSAGMSRWAACNAV